MIDSTPKAHTFAGSGVQESEEESPSSTERQLVSLFGELRVPLLRYLSSFPLSIQDAEDVVQEAFLSLYQQLCRGRSVHEVRGWLFRAAHSLALKKRLRSRRDLESADSFSSIEHLAPDPALNPEDLLVFNRTQERVQGVVRALPQQDRWCLYLRAEGLRYRQIAEILNMSLGSVSSCLERSLARITRAVKR